METIDVHIRIILEVVQPNTEVLIAKPASTGTVRKELMCGGCNKPVRRGAREREGKIWHKHCLIEKVEEPKADEPDYVSGVLAEIEKKKNPAEAALDMIPKKKGKR